jgi:hypothetical protein
MMPKHSTLVWFDFQTKDASALDLSPSTVGVHDVLQNEAPGYIFHGFAGALTATCRDLRIK